MKKRLIKQMQLKKCGSTFLFIQVIFFTRLLYYECNVIACTPTSLSMLFVLDKHLLKPTYSILSETFGTTGL